MARTCDAFPEGFEILEIKIIILHYIFYLKESNLNKCGVLRLTFKEQTTFSGFTFFLPYTRNFRYRG